MYSGCIELQIFSFIQQLTDCEVCEREISRRHDATECDFCAGLYFAKIAKYRDYLQFTGEEVKGLNKALISYNRDEN